MFRRALYYCIAVALIAVTTFMLTPDTVENGFHLRFQMTMAMTLLSIQVSSVWLFTSSLGTFSNRFKVGYIILSLGIFLLGIAQVQLPLLVMLNAVNTFWVSWGIILVPYLASSVASYFGVLQFAKTLGLKSFAVTPWKVFLVATLAAVVSTQLPHLRVTGSQSAEMAFDIYVALSVWCAILTSAISYVAYRVAGGLGALYVGAMKWLAVAFASGTLGWLWQWYSTVMLPKETWINQYGLGLVPLLITGLLGLLAGAAFKKVSEQKIAPDASYIDVVINTAQLVSDPRSIEPVVLKIRNVTSHLVPNQEPGSRDKAALLQAYRELEDYIVTKEAVRKFTRDELRARLPEPFEKALIAG